VTGATATGEADAGFRFEVIGGDFEVTGDEEVGDEEPEFLDGPGAGMVENETLLLEALEPDRDRFLILDKNREVVPSFFSGLGGPVMVTRDEEPAPAPAPVIELGVAEPELLLFALTCSLNFFWWSS
jgi:hypothetical protein